MAGDSEMSSHQAKYYNDGCSHCHTMADIRSMPSYASDSYFQNPSRPFQPRGSVQMPGPPVTSSGDFDILDWHPAYQSCQKYFLDHSQHEPGTQALCALINIRLPFQWRLNPLYSSTLSSPGSRPNGQSGPSTSSYSFDTFPRQNQSPSGPNAQQIPDTPAFVSLVPYVRRLVITGFDKSGILHGLFGDAWQAGITPLQDCERRNYLFAAKHGGWRSCKKQYDLNEEETVPFLKPLENVKPGELDAADKSWSSWLAMEDWMIGPRAPDGEDQGPRSTDRSYRGHGNLPDGH